MPIPKVIAQGIDRPSNKVYRVVALPGDDQHLTTITVEERSEYDAMGVDSWVLVKDPNLSSRIAIGAIYDLLRRITKP